MIDIDVSWFIAKNSKDLLENTGYESVEAMQYPVLIIEMSAEGIDSHVFIQEHELQQMLKMLQESKYESVTTA